MVTCSQYEKDKGEEDAYFQALGIEILFSISHLVGAVGDVRPKLPRSIETSSFPIIVQTLTGKSITLSTANNQLVIDLKEAILEAEGVQPRVQRLIYRGKQLDDMQQVYELGLEPYATIYMVMKIPGGGCPTYYIDDSQLDPTFDYDFSSKEDDGTPFTAAESATIVPTAGSATH